MKKIYFQSAAIGEHFPLVPISHFSKFRFKKQEWEEVWKIIGPSVQWNINKHPLWIVIAAAYLEGLQHGSEIKKENNAQN